MKIDTFIFQTWKFNVVENLGKVKICENLTQINKFTCKSADKEDLLTP